MGQRLLANLLKRECVNGGGWPVYIFLTLLVQCYIPFTWKLCHVKKLDSRVVLLLNYAVTVTISTVIAAKSDLFSVFSYLPQCDFSNLMMEKSLPSTAGITLMLGILSGFIFYFSLYSSQRNISVNGMGISSFFTQMGLVASVIVAFAFFDEQISKVQWIAMAGIVLSVLLMTCNNQKICIKSPMQLVIVCVLNVMVGVCNKFYAKYALDMYKNVFLAIAFLVAFLAAGINVASDVRHKKTALSIRWQEFFCGITMGAANLLYSYLNLRCLEIFSAALVIPIISAGGLVLSTLVSILFFKEQTSRRHILAMLLVCAFIFLLNQNA